MQKKSKTIRTEADTGEIYLITQKQKRVDKQHFVKLFTEILSERCKDDKFWEIPFGFIIWIVDHLDFDGRISVSKVDLERVKKISHDRVSRLFALLEKHDVIWKIDTIGTTYRWGVNPNCFHRGDKQQKQRNSNNLRQMRFEFDIKNGRIPKDEIEKTK